MIKGEDRFVRRTQDLRSLPVVTPGGQLVPLESVAEVREFSSGPEQILHRERRLDVVEVRADVQRAYNEALQQRFERTVWRSRPGSAWQLPFSSWYAPGDGRNTALWPGLSAGYWLAMRHAAIADYTPVA